MLSWLSWKIKFDISLLKMATKLRSNLSSRQSVIVSLIVLIVDEEGSFSFEAPFRAFFIPDHVDKPVNLVA
jgi:hypothetical protein